ncbi:MAG: ABC transporter permease [Anaerolineales bacterium]|nr:ABC transporter permease [Anaerolineales bacterium]
MLNYIIRRLLIMPIILLGVSLLLFSIISLMKPIDRAKAMFTTDIPNRLRDWEGLIEKFGLDDPVYLQYWHWLVGIEDPDTGDIRGGILRGNLGYSWSGRSSVADVIKRRGPASAELVLWSAFPIIGFGIWMGVKAAVHHNKLIDHILRFSAIAGWSIPAFVIGFLLIMYFSSRLHWFSPGRLTLEVGQIVQSEGFVNYTKMHTIDALLNLRLDVFLDALRHLVLPVITLSVTSWAFLLRMTRFSMLETLNQEYITTARAKGLHEDTIVRRHALPNALIPVITVGGLALVGLFNGVVITEVIFNYPGLGSFLAESAIALDLVSVAGVTLFFSVILVVANLVVDILYMIIDPRIRLD